MKTIKILLSSIILSVIVISCSSDDDSTVVEVPNNPEVAGEYNLTFLNAPVAVDYNQDGTPSQNLMMESVCYIDSQIILNEDMTYTSTDSYVFFLSDTGCQSEERFGTWAIDGDIVTLTDMTMELTSTKEYTLNNNELIRTEINAQYPTRDEQGNPVYTEGDLQYYFTRTN